MNTSNDTTSPLPSLGQSESGASLNPEIMSPAVLADPKPVHPAAYPTNAEGPADRELRQTRVFVPL